MTQCREESRSRDSAESEEDKGVACADAGIPNRAGSLVAAKALAIGMRACGDGW